MYRFLERCPANNYVSWQEYLLFEDDDQNVVAVTEDWKFWFPVEKDKYQRYVVLIKKGKSLDPAGVLRRTFDKAYSEHRLEE